MAQIKLVATEGMILTDGKTYGKEVFLGSGDSPDNWYEIMEEEYQRMQDAADERENMK